MARPLRVEYPGAYYHIINRGNNREKIFRDNRDKEKFLEYLGIASERFSIIIHTYCLMDNHYHLLIETPEANLSVAMQWINVSYAGYFNAKRNRSGHLFQGRFKSILVDADEYLKHVSRYIHLNPVRAKIVAKPLEYRWSSYPAFIGREKKPDWLETGWLLTVFGRKKQKAVVNFRLFVEGTDDEAIENMDEIFILGNESFVTWVKDTFLSVRDDEKEIPQLKKLKPKISPDLVVQEIRREFDCAIEDIVTRGRKNNTARDIAICLARNVCGMKGSELGEYFGNVSGASITMTHKRATEFLKNDKRYKDLVNRVSKRIFKI